MQLVILLQTVDPEPLDMDLIYRRLDEIPNLRTMSITGGEPMFSKKSIRNVVKPLLKVCTSSRYIYTNEFKPNIASRSLFRYC